MLCGWEGNRRSGVALAMRHRLRGLSTYGLNGHCVLDEHLAYALGAQHLYLYLYNAYLSLQFHRRRHHAR